MTETPGHGINQDPIAYLSLMVNPWVMEAQAALSTAFINRRLL